MTWRVVTSTRAWADIERFDQADQAAISDALFAWLDQGPPLGQSRIVAGIEIFECDISPGYRATYFVKESDHYVAIFRVRRV